MSSIGEYRLRLEKVVRQVEDYDGEPDILLVTTKVFSGGMLERSESSQLVKEIMVEACCVASLRLAVNFHQN